MFYEIDLRMFKNVYKSFFSQVNSYGKMRSNVVRPSMKLLEVSLSCLHFSLMFSKGEVNSPCFLQVWWALVWRQKKCQRILYYNQEFIAIMVNMLILSKKRNNLDKTLAWQYHFTIKIGGLRPYNLLKLLLL